jgi:hypothetical protein
MGCGDGWVGMEVGLAMRLAVCYVKINVCDFHVTQQLRESGEARRDEVRRVEG